MENNAGLLERIFHLKDSGTTAKTEIMAGITTFMTMAYILAVNPSIMSTTGMDKAAVLTATAIAGFMGTMLMAVFANYPFALAPGMGLNAFFAYTVIGQMGYSWQMALAAVTVSILFLLSLFFSPFFMAIPAFATAPALVSVGFLMFTAVTGIDFDDPTEAFPCYLTIIAMPFTYSIAEGIAFGIISYTLINLLAGNRSKVSLLMIILTVLFVMKYIFI